MCGRYALGDEFDAVQERVNAEYLNRRRQQRRERRDQQRDQAREQQQQDQPQLDFAANEQQQNEQEQEEPIVRWANDVSKDKYRPRYNVAPQTFCPVIRHSGSTADEESYVIDLMKWGLVPHWQKQPPDAPLKTINCRDDTLFSGSGMWSGIRGRNRCIIVAQGFFEWLKKSNDKIAHFTKPADGKLMVMAGLWDSVKYEGSDEALKTFTIITTSSNKQLNFLHDRMPALLSDPDEIATWLKPGPWTKELQALIRPYEGKLECYKVPREVGSVKNDSPDFIKPISERKGNLASFFAKTPTKEAKASTTNEGVKDEETRTDLRMNPDEGDKAEAPSSSSKRSRGRDSSIEIVDSSPPTKKVKPAKKQKRESSPAVDEQGNAKVTSFFKKES